MNVEATQPPCRFTRNWPCACLGLSGRNELHELTEDLLDGVRAYIDLTVHENQLSSLAAPITPDTQPDGAAEEDEEEETLSLLEVADMALEEGDYERAALLLEEAISELGTGNREAKFLHLDLARLYIRLLFQPRAAIPHLRAFVTHWPDDPSAQSVRAQLCDLLRQSGDGLDDCELDGTE